MDAYKQKIFAGYVREQCTHVILAAWELDAASLRGDVSGVFYHMQSLLSAAANVSKLLWASEDGSKRIERDPLRKMFSVDETSPLFVRKLRNDLDHFDDRLDTWWNTCPNHNIIDRIIGHPNIIDFAEKRDQECFRAYDPNTATAYFWNKSYSTRELTKEAERLLQIGRRVAI